MPRLDIPLERSCLVTHLEVNYWRQSSRIVPVRGVASLRLLDGPLPFLVVILPLVVLESDERFLSN